jgi:hypothetical protein
MAATVSAYSMLLIRNGMNVADSDREGGPLMLLGPRPASNRMRRGLQMLSNPYPQLSIVPEV